jgi:type II secretory pathway component PulM
MSRINNFASAASTWFLHRTPRERTVLLGGLLVLFIYVCVMLLFKPLLQARELSSQRVQSAQQSLQAVTILSEELMRMRSEVRVSRGRQNLSQMIDASAGESGLILTALEPSADGQAVSVRVDNAVFGDVLLWLAALEQTGQLQIDSLTLVPSSSGQVAVSLRLRNP